MPGTDRNSMHVAERDRLYVIDSLSCALSSKLPQHRLSRRSKTHRSTFANTTSGSTR